MKKFISKIIAVVATVAISYLPVAANVGVGGHGDDYTVNTNAANGVAIQSVSYQWDGTNYVPTGTNIMNSSGKMAAAYLADGKTPQQVVIYDQQGHQIGYAVPVTDNSGNQVQDSNNGNAAEWRVTYQLPNGGSITTIEDGSQNGAGFNGPQLTQEQALAEYNQCVAAWNGNKILDGSAGLPANLASVTFAASTVANNGMWLDAGGGNTAISDAAKADQVGMTVTFGNIDGKNVVTNITYNVAGEQGINFNGYNGSNAATPTAFPAGAYNSGN